MHLSYSKKARYKIFEERVTYKEIKRCISAGSKKINADGTIMAKYGPLTLVYRISVRGYYVISLWVGAKGYKVTR